MRTAISSTFSSAIARRSGGGRKSSRKRQAPFCPLPSREKLTGYAVEAARAVGYQNAGTVEFIADADLNIYFLEMNTRLQVEHPVTEMVTGLDLVEWQLRMAAGEPLPLRQDQISLRAMPSRRGFARKIPMMGSARRRASCFARPVSRDGIRVDSGVEENSEVSPYYDSMVAKVIADGRDRAEAARRLLALLEDDPLLGFATNQQFLAHLLRSKEFRQSSLSTDTLDAWLEADAPLFKRPSPSREVWALAAALYADRGSVGEWFWSGNAFDFSLDLDCGGERKMVRYKRSSEGTIAVSFDGGEAEITLIDVRLPDVVFEASGVRRRAIAVWDGANLHLSTGGFAFVFREAEHARRGSMSPMERGSRRPWLAFSSMSSPSRGRSWQPGKRSRLSRP